MTLIWAEMSLNNRLIELSIDGRVTHQWLIAFYELDNLDGLLILIHLNRHLGQMRIEILLCNGIVCKE